jgi:hypothetical protein
MSTLDIHERRRRLELVTERIRKSDAISDEDRRLILGFMDFCFAEGLSVDRVEHYLHILNKLAERMGMMGAGFANAGRYVLVKLVGWVKRRDISDWTKHDYNVALKKFYK